MLNLINVPGIQAKARDSQRQADLSKVQTALELYFAEHRVYPIHVANTVTVLTADLIPTYISVIPVDPTGLTGFSLCVTNPTGYTYRSDGVNYVLTASMEVVRLSLTDSHLCSNVPNCSIPALACSCNDPRCYAVQNPR